jgi:hypothetical protein
MITCFEVYIFLVIGANNIIKELKSDILMKKGMNPLDPKSYKSLILLGRKAAPAKDFKGLVNLAGW